MSEPFMATRGVRQGDPLSCLLFNLAIEPLACLIRASGLKGVRVPGTNQDLVVSLFADDTSVYLSSKDSLSVLWEILHLWCAASTAKFNQKKTVVLPFGSARYRAKVLRERRINTEERIGEIPTTIRIIPDGQTCRMLGAWIGNITPYITPWPAQVEKSQAALKDGELQHQPLRVSTTS
jgi:hypothetical protein